MGTINHNAVLATTWKREEYERLREWVQQRPYFRNLFVFVPSEFEWLTIVLAPDGSKEGWEDSDKGDSLRAEFIAKMKETDTPPHEDDPGGSYWQIVEVGYGEYGAAVVWTNCTNRYGDEPYAVALDDCAEAANAAEVARGEEP